MPTSFRPAYLELREQARASGHQRYDVLWKVPAQGELRLAVHVRFPPGTKEITPPQGRFSDNAYVERWRIAREPAGWSGRRCASMASRAGSPT